MSESKRKNFTGEFKAKVALEAIRGIKTVNQIGQEFGVRSISLPSRQCYGSRYNFTVRFSLKFTWRYPRTRQGNAQPRPSNPCHGRGVSKKPRLHHKPRSQPVLNGAANLKTVSGARHAHIEQAAFLVFGGIGMR